MNYNKIKNKVYNHYGHTVASLSRISQLSEKRLRNFFNQNGKHNIWRDLFIVLRIANSLEVEAKELLA